MKRLLFDCAVVALVAAGAYRWTHRPVPARPPAIRGAMPNLDMPAPAGPPSADSVDSARLVVREDAGRPERHLPGVKRREKTLGDKPRLLGAPAVDVTDSDVSYAVPADEPSSWEERLRRPWAAGAVAALFVVIYALGTRALRKGPGGRGFTHD